MIGKIIEAILKKENIQFHWYIKPSFVCSVKKLSEEKEEELYKKLSEILKPFRYTVRRVYTTGKVYFDILPEEPEKRVFEKVVEVRRRSGRENYKVKILVLFAPWRGFSRIEKIEIIGPDGTKKEFNEWEVDRIKYVCRSKRLMTAVKAEINRIMKVLEEEERLYKKKLEEFAKRISQDL